MHPLGRYRDGRYFDYLQDHGRGAHPGTGRRRVRSRPDGYAKVAAGSFTGSPPFYATPTWQTAHPEWSWLNRCQGFGVGRVVLEQLQVRCDIYLPKVGGALPGPPNA